MTATDSFDPNLDVTLQSASALVAGIGSRTVSSVEVLDACLARVEAVNPRLNAVTRVLESEARAAAAAADAAVASGETLGPLHGLPVTIKENLDVAGTPTTNGVVALAEAIAPVDAPLVAQLRAAGAIPFARTNLPEFSFRWQSDNALHGATVNPWDEGIVSGGSSGGEAVALATGMSPLGIGNDYAGSLRQPAQANGIVALKSTTGRIAHASSIPPLDFQMSLQLMGVHGPMARHVADVRLALDCISGPDLRDPFWVPAGDWPVGGALPGVAVVTAAGGHVDPDVRAGLERAAQALETAGYDVEEAEPPGIAEATQLWFDLFRTEVDALMIGAIEQMASADALQQFRDFMSLGTSLDRDGYAAAFVRRRELARNWSEFQANRIVLAPVSTEQPWPVGFDIGGPDNVREMVQAHRMIFPVNVFGLPSLALPVGLSEKGLPQGVQIIGHPFAERMILDAGEAIEAEVGSVHVEL